MKMIRSTIIALLTLAAISSLGALLLQEAAAKRGSTVEREGYELSELHKDFAQFERTIKNRHPMTYADEEELERLLDEGYDLLEEGMSQLEFYRLLSPIAAKLNCGHSNIMISEAYETEIRLKARFFPFMVRLMDDGLYIVSALSRTVPPGAKIVSINGNSASRITDVLTETVPSDGVNGTRKREIIARQFPYLYHTLIDESDRFILRYRKPESGKTESARVEGVSFSALWSDRYRISSIGILMDMAELKEDYDGRLYDDYAVLEVGSFIVDNGDFSDFLADFFAEVSRRQIDSLVVDLRGNWGGTPKPAALLLPYLTDEAFPYFPEDAPFYLFKYKRPMQPADENFQGRCVFLVDGACFSTTAHFLALAVFNGLGTTVGQEAGGSYLCTDGKRKTELNNTGLRLYCATAEFAAAVSGIPGGRGLMPEHPVYPSIDDYVNGRDPVMKRALNILGVEE